VTGEPRVTVVMPVFNGAALIDRALPTVLGQSFRDFELIVVDDCSTDDLAGALARYPDPRIRLVRHEVNRGVGSGRNTGVREARGAYVAFVDCDDEWLPTKLERQLGCLEASPPDIAVSITGYYLMRDRLGRREARPLNDEPDWYMRLLAGCNVSFGSCALVRRTLFDEIGPFDEAIRRLEDWDWLLRYTATRPIANVAEPLAIIHTGMAWPSVDAVSRATQQVWERHEKPVTAHSDAARRLLLSTIRYERAAALYHHRRPLAAIWSALRAALVYPARRRGFYRHLLRRTGDILHWRFG
jgi:glycosyltransferase involved in cell wall biosynthesis